MTQKLLLLFLASFLMFSCNNMESEEVNLELEKLRTENRELTEEIEAKDATLNLFEESFTTIQNNLGLISEREKGISMHKELNEINLSREEITRDIQAINNLLQENKNTIANLKAELEKSGLESSGFQKMIEQLSLDVESKEEEITYLKENLTAANFTIEILNEMLDSAEFRNEIQKSIIDMQYSELNTAYYTIGTFKDLRDNGVLTKDGTIIGLGGTKQLKEDFNRSFFAQIDITKFNELKINSKEVRIVTNHPKSSYTLEDNDGNTKKLKIGDASEFWSTSKYLVIETK